MKKVISILLALVLVFALTAVVFAADDPVKNDQITVTSAKPGETYKLYKLFDLSVNDEISPTAYSYTVNSAWADFFKPAEGSNPAGPGNKYITINDAGYVTKISDAAALALAASTWANKPEPTQTVTVAEDGSNAVFSSLEDGYWLVTSTLGTYAMTETTPDRTAVTIVEKNPEDTIYKEVKEDSTGTFGESNDAQIGDLVYFKSTVRIVKGTRNVVVHDKMDAGLTFTPGSVAISGLTSGTEFSVNESPSDGDTFDISFTQSWIDGLEFGSDGYLDYEITYTATLNENAVKAVTGDDETITVSLVSVLNKTHVTFGDSSSSVEDSTTTTSHKFSVYKHAKDSTDNLAGAVFSLKKNGAVVSLIKIDDNNYRVAKSGESGTVTTFTTVADGDIVIWGVDSDSDYTLLEVDPPKGYNKLTAEVDVTVDAGNGTRIDVENKAGTELPSTGGVGTTVFYIVGGLMVLGAVVVLVSKKRVEE